MIRVLTEKDTDAFIEIRMYGLKESPAAFGADPEEGIDRDLTYSRLGKHSDEYFSLGYFEKDRLAGIVGFIRSERLKRKHLATIWGMYVLPEFRGKGIAKQLLQECIRKARKIKGLSKINLSVTHTQKGAKKLYEHFGFTTFGCDKNALQIDGMFIDETFMSMEW